VPGSRLAPRLPGNLSKVDSTVCPQLGQFGILYPQVADAALVSSMRLMRTVTCWRSGP
jgi:hypothetical protein